MPAKGTTFNTQSRAEFVANWERQVGCPAQYDAPTLESVWSEMVASDPVGATWGTGVRRAPQVTSWGWNKDVVAKTHAAVTKTAEWPEVRKRIEDTGSLLVLNTPDQFSAQIKAEFEVYKQVVDKQKLKLE